MNTEWLVVAALCLVLSAFGDPEESTSSDARQRGALASWPVSAIIETFRRAGKSSPALIDIRAQVSQASSPSTTTATEKATATASPSAASKGACRYPSRMVSMRYERKL